MAIGVVYLVSSIGATGENLSRLREIAEFIATLGVPWVLLGDFNMSPDLLLESGFLEITWSRVRVPDDAEYTCDVSMTMIDYAVCSRDVAPLVKVRTVLESPFKTHACLHVTIDADVLEQVVQRRGRAGALP
eukprot:4448583-Pyramimonas_sp.AAC.1